MRIQSVVVHGDRWSSESYRRGAIVQGWVSLRYGTPDNDRAFFPLGRAREVLEYFPRDNSAAFDDGGG